MISVLELELDIMEAYQISDFNAGWDLQKIGVLSVQRYLFLDEQTITASPSAGCAGGCAVPGAVHPSGAAQPAGSIIGEQSIQQTRRILRGPDSR